MTTIEFYRRWRELPMDHYGFTDPAALAIVLGLPVEEARWHVMRLYETGCILACAHFFTATSEEEAKDLLTQGEQIGEADKDRWRRFVKGALDLVA